jgi:valyl-tRNA synthetase
VLLRLFAPFLPFCTEEAWSWWHDDSVHISPWPAPGPGTSAAGSDLMTTVGIVISAIRKSKSAAKQSMRAPVNKVRVQGPAGRLKALQGASGDICAAGNIDTLIIEPDSRMELSVDVELARVG